MTSTTVQKLLMENSVREGELSGHCSAMCQRVPSRCGLGRRTTIAPLKEQFMAKLDSTPFHPKPAERLALPAAA